MTEKLSSLLYTMGRRLYRENTMVKMQLLLQAAAQKRS